jgi:hypothetical protein
VSMVQCTVLPSQENEGRKQQASSGNECNEVRPNPHAGMLSDVSADLVTLLAERSALS